MDHGPPYENVHLGDTLDRAYGRRLLSLCKGLVILWRERATLRRADAFYALNTDNALLAVAARSIASKDLPLFFEIDDIQSPFIGRSVKSRVLRWIERRVLIRTTCLVTTSPAFVREYFEPLQGYRGDIFLLENKVYPSFNLVEQRAAPPSPGPPWQIGWFGALRCQRSWDTMRALAARYPDQLRFVIRGYPTAIDADAFFEQVTAPPNIAFGGPYRYPDDLPSMHSELHFVWALDFSQLTANSRWLLPNRLYEGGLFHVPMLAARDTEAGRWVESHGVGAIVNGAQLEQDLEELFSTLTAEQWQAWQLRLGSTPDATFAGEDDYAALNARLVEAAAV
jgi:succinoglycan biosynthesis protein ExoL